MSPRSTCADRLVEAIVDHGPACVFGLPGVHNLGLWRAFSEASIRLVGVRHEQAAVYAADGFARSTGQIGIAFTTTGPGVANTVGAVGEAWASHVPVVVVATDIPASLRDPRRYRGVLHEAIDQRSIVTTITKAQFRIDDPKRARSLMREAMDLAATSPPGPVFVEVPTDVLEVAVSATEAMGEGAAGRGGQTSARVDPYTIDRAVAAIDASRRPLIWAGGGVVAAKAEADLADLAELLAAPVITTYSAAGVLGSDHPCAVGLPPHVSEVGKLWDEADLVIGVGTDFDGTMTQNWCQPAPQTLVSINISEGDVSKNYGADVAVVADASLALASLVERLGPREGLLDLRRYLDQLRKTVMSRLRADTPSEVRFVELMQSVVPSDVPLFVDLCVPGYWLAAFHRPARSRRMLYPMGWGTLGYALPAAMGGAVSGAPCALAMLGDGGFLMGPGELATIAQEGLPVVAVIVDDHGYGMLRHAQARRGHRAFGVDFRSPDLVALAESFGLRGRRVSGLGEDFAHELEHALERGGPSVLVADAEFDPPPTVSAGWYRAESS